MRGWFRSEEDQLKEAAVAVYTCDAHVLNRDFSRRSLLDREDSNSLRGPTV